MVSSLKDGYLNLDVSSSPFSRSLFLSFSLCRCFLFSHSLSVSYSLILSLSLILSFSLCLSLSVSLSLILSLSLGLSFFLSFSLCPSRMFPVGFPYPRVSDHPLAHSPSPPQLLPPQVCCSLLPPPHTHTLSPCWKPISHHPPPASSGSLCQRNSWWLSAHPGSRPRL